MSFTDEKALRVAFYIRVSTEEQGRDGFGADAQLLGLQSMMKYKGSVSNWVHKEAWIYKDLGCTGSNLERPEYKRMIDDAAKGKFDVIAVWKIDRLSRTLADLLNVIKKLDELGVSFISLQENIDVTGPMGRFFMQIFGAIAELERETIKVRTKEGKIASAKNGNYVNPSTPFGYVRKKSGNRVGNTLVINEEEAFYVRKIFHDFNRGMSLESIASYLNKERVLKASETNRKTRDTKWYGNSVKVILKNRTYAGSATMNIRENGKVVDQVGMKVPPIIPVISYELAQNNLLKVAENARSGGGEHEYLLSRKIIDVESGRKMISVHRTKGGHSYRRKGFELNGKVYKNREIPGEPLEKHVWSLIESIIDRPEDLLAVYKKQSLSASDYSSLTDERKRFSDAIQDADSAECTILEEYSYGRLQEERKNQVLSTISARKKNAQENIDLIDKKLNAIFEAQKTSEALKHFGENFDMRLKSLSYKQKAFLIDLLIDKIEVTWGPKEAKIHVVVRFDQSKVSKNQTRLHQKNSSGITNSHTSEPNIDINGGGHRIRTYDPLLVRQVL